MSIKACIESFLENFVELGLQRVNVRDARRALGYPFGSLLFEFKEIEIETAVRNFFGAHEGFFGNGEQRKTGRERERFLHAGQHDVDAERVHVDLHRGKRRDRVDDENDIGVFRERAADFRQRVHYAGRRFVMNQRHGVEFSGGERTIDIFLVDVFSPIDLQWLGVFSAAPGDIEPFIGERSTHAAKQSGAGLAVVADQVADRRFHHAPG